MSKIDPQTDEAIKELVAKISTSKFKEKVRNRIDRENEQFLEEELQRTNSKCTCNQFYN